MQTKFAASTGVMIPYAGLSAVLAGLCYTSRWVWELSEGILKNKQYPPSFITQNFFLVKILLMIVLATIFQLVSNKRTFIGVLAACSGLLWTSITRTLEAYGAPGPWGFYSSPGLLLFFSGSLVLGLAITNLRPFVLTGRILTAISFLYFLGGLASMLLFNLFGRTESANIAASFIANLFLIAEGVCWIVLGVLLLLYKNQHTKSVTALRAD